MNLIQISQNFPNEEEATNYFEYFRWGTSVRCSHCGSNNIGKRSSDFRYYCNPCERRFSVTTGTMLENTNLSLIKWIFAFAVITNAKKGFLLYNFKEIWGLVILLLGQCIIKLELSCLMEKLN